MRAGSAECEGHLEGQTGNMPLRDASEEDMEDSDMDEATEVDDYGMASVCIAWSKHLHGNLLHIYVGMQCNSVLAVVAEGSMEIKTVKTDHN